MCIRICIYIYIHQQYHNIMIYIYIHIYKQLQCVSISYVDVCGSDTLTYVIVSDLQSISDEDISLKLVGDPRIKCPRLIQKDKSMMPKNVRCSYTQKILSSVEIKWV